MEKVNKNSRRMMGSWTNDQKNCNIAVFESGGMGPQSMKCEWPSETGEGKRTDLSPDTPGRTHPGYAFIFTQ